MALALQAIEFLHLDRLWWIPANPWQKNPSELIASEDRLAMLKLAVGKNEQMAVDVRELTREGLSYSIDTVKELARDFPNDQRFYLIGSDQWKNFLWFATVFGKIPTKRSLTSYNQITLKFSKCRCRQLIWIQAVSVLC